jgi:ribonuclease VapC
VIIDSSAIVAIVLREPGYEELVGKLRSADASGVGTPTLVKAGIVLTRISHRKPEDWFLSRR